MIRLALLATLVLALTGPAFAQGGPSPVMVTSLSIQPAFIGGGVPQPGSVKVSFMNLAQVPATEVDFALISKKTGAVYRTTALTGTFSSGVEIKHAWSTEVPNTDQTGVVTRVVFANGKVWKRS